MSKGYRVLPIRSVTDLFDDWKDEHPRGYEKGDTYDHVGVLTVQDLRLVVIAETARPRRRWVKLEDRTLLAAAVEHEIGHAVDFSLGEKPFSNTREFITA